jgi:hypothetical protein
VKPIVQRPSECSLASIATLNGLSQKDYEAISDLAKERGARYSYPSRSPARLIKSIAIGVELIKELGFYVPEGYPGGNPTAPPANPDFSGTGIVRVSYIPKRKRKPVSHVLTFANGAFYESNGTRYASWDEWEKQCKAWGIRQLTVRRIFR